MTCKPLGVEIYEFDDPRAVVGGWESPKPADYGGLHGVFMPFSGMEVNSSFV